MAAAFVHLHVHSQYSLLDGAIRVKDLVKRTAAMGMGAVALTDHRNMFGAIALYKAAKAAGVKPILGAELDVWVNGRVVHLPVLAENSVGYSNLVKLVSRGHVVSPKGSPMGHPCVTVEDLGAHREGLVMLTGCMGGYLSMTVLEEGEAAGRKALANLVEVVGAERIYVELQDHGLVEQPILNRIAMELAKEFSLPLVATNCVHYPGKDDAEAQILLGCIKTGRSLQEARERHHGSREMYFKSASEMAQMFGHVPSAMANTLAIAERCTLKLDLGKSMLPSFAVPEGYDTESYFRHVSREGLAARFRDFAAAGKVVSEGDYQRRLETELDVIARMKFPGYFLIVWDFIRYARGNGIPVGPGRGSGAGSIVAYALRITDLDPLPYNLLFERFLNPERVSMPDFDIDFCMDKRDRVIAYVQEKYGLDSVGQISTFAELKSKSVVKDVGRALGFSPMDSQALANLIPKKNPAETYTIAESLAIEPKLKARYDTEPRVKELLDQGQRLEGMLRQTGKHAAGIVIAEGPLWDHVPVLRDEKTGVYVTQYYKDDVEQAGLVKFDFLGLKTLTVLDLAVGYVNGRPEKLASGEKLDLSAISLDDKATYALLGSGETKGVFQLESSGMQKLFKDLRADCFEDVVAAVALYRPGPLGSGMVKNFVECKNGRQPIQKMHALVDEVLVPTYGVIVYQEQVMQVAQNLAGYSLGGADLLRRAMGKKMPEEMEKQRSTFVEGARQKGVTEADAESIFKLLEYFAGYGFNKSHSAAYALITYQTAWLKAHYPAELVCAVLTADKDVNDKVVRTIADARLFGLPVLPPDVNESHQDFRVVYASPAGDAKVAKGAKVRDAFAPQLRFGLGAVRGIGEAAIEAIKDARDAGGPFRDMFDFASRVDARRVTKAVFEALVQSGAYDTCHAVRGIDRARAFASIDVALERSRAASRDREAGQTSLFGLFGAGAGGDAGAQAAASAAAGDFVKSDSWDTREVLVRERRALGFYVSGHPIDRYVNGPAALARLEASWVADCAQLEDWTAVRLVGTVEGWKEKIFKGSNDKKAFFELEDTSGRIQVAVRSREIQAFERVLLSGEPVIVSGKLQFPRSDNDDDEADVPRDPTLLLNDAQLLSESVKSAARSLHITVDSYQLTSKALTDLASLFRASAGTCPIHVHVKTPAGVAQVVLGADWRVDAGDVLFAGLERVFGGAFAELR